MTQVNDSFKPVTGVTGAPAIGAVANLPVSNGSALADCPCEIDCSIECHFYCTCDGD